MGNAKLSYFEQAKAIIAVEEGSLEGLPCAELENLLGEHESTVEYELGRLEEEAEALLLGTSRLALCLLAHLVKLEGREVTDFGDHLLIGGGLLVSYDAKEEWYLVRAADSDEGTTHSSLVQLVPALMA